jgi:hypothetical protein
MHIICIFFVHYFFKSIIESVELTCESLWVDSTNLMVNLEKWCTKNIQVIDVQKSFLFTNNNYSIIYTVSLANA